MLLLLGMASLLIADTRPNVIVIMADDLGAEGLGCYDSTIYTTPNLDRMAARVRALTMPTPRPSAHPLGS